MIRFSYNAATAGPRWPRLMEKGRTLEMVAAQPQPDSSHDAPAHGLAIDPLRRTKFFVPEVQPEAVVRTRLIRSIGCPPLAPLTVVVAPPGFGKTTLLAAAFEGFGARRAWLSLDRLDNDPVRFLRHLVGALLHAETGIGQRAEQLLRGPQPVPPAGVLSDLVNEISESPFPVVLVIDDYHLIDNRVVHDALDTIFEHVTPQLRVVVSSRQPPPFSIARLRVRDQLHEFTAEQLRFRRNEIASYVQSCHPAIPIDEALLDSLEEKTEGWIGALRLLCRSVDGDDDPAQRIESFSGDHRYIADYLAEEVIAQLPEEGRKFLRRTSIVDRMSGSLCNAVAGVEDGQERLRQMEDDGLLLVPIDRKRSWYRYHNLFRDVLRHQLLEDSADEVAALHQQAATWHADHGLLAEALSHAIAGEDWEGTRRLMAPIEQEMLREGRFHEVLHWLDAIPAEIRRQHGEMALSYAWAALMSGTLARVSEPLEQAEAFFEQQEDAVRLAETAVIRGHYERFRGDSIVALERIEAAIPKLPSPSALRCHALLGNGVLVSNVRSPKDSIDILLRCLEEAEAVDAPLMFFAATNVLSNQEIYLGQLHRAAERLRTALDRAGDHPHSQIIETHSALAMVLREWNRLDDAETHYRAAIAIAIQRQVEAFWPHSHIGLARIHRARGKIDDAREEMTIALRLISESGYTKAVDTVGAWNARLSLELGDLGAARAWVRERPSRAVAAVSRGHVAVVSVSARVLLTEGRYHDAADQLQQCAGVLRAEGRLLELVEILLLLGQAYVADGQEDAAIDSAHEATRVAAPAAALWTFLEELPAIAPLLGALRSRTLSDLERSFIDEVVQVGAATNTLPSVLSRREREVLHLIDEGGSNDDIARALFISTNTVKTHIRKIFEKLEVHNRTQALSRARELGLL
ncbi:MAG: LuxR C-terminal-related transcriptional regulator [Planctomycetota bacterium]